MDNYKSKKILYFLFIFNLLNSNCSIQQVATASTGITTTTTTTKKPNDKNESFSILKELEELEREGSKLVEEVKDKNKTIIINGRKFDQINPIECVDKKFYNLLMKDLELIDPNRQIDYYGTYYDYEYAKAVSALVDTPRSPSWQKSEKENKIERIGSEDSVKPNKNDKIQDNANNDYFNGKANILEEAIKFWQKTIEQYNSTAREIGELNNNNDINNIKNPTKALSNHHFLLSQMELLKLMLLNGEEALIVLNNKVKKLNQAVDENELHTALCSCITSRGGKAALMLINELFVDKNSFKVLKDLSIAKRKAEAASLDVAEYCSYWYGDTIRSQAIQKEKLIKKLVLKEAKARNINKNNNSTTTNNLTNSTNDAKGSSSRKKVVNSLIEMTSLWLPQLANWINKTLGPSNLIEKRKLLIKEEINNDKRIKRDILIWKSGEQELNSFSNPFDLRPGYNYGELDSDIDDNKASNIFDIELKLKKRKKRETVSSSSSFDSSSTSSSSSSSSSRSVTFNGVSITTTKAPEKDEPSETTKSPIEEPNFESRVSIKASECAHQAFTKLLSIAYDQSALIYGDSSIPKDHVYIAKLNDAYLESFPKFWIERRDLWSKNLTSNSAQSNDNDNNRIRRGRGKKKGSHHYSTNENEYSNPIDREGGSGKGKTVDEEIDDSFEELSSSSSYDRGARLGYTIGKFIGEKASNQWPDPAELNTFTYDSMFLGGVAHGYNERDSQLLEQLIVGETAKRVAFTEANRQAFGKAIHLAYLNGAFVVPIWGVLHAQRSVAKRVAKEGGRIGYSAAAKAANDFAPKATKFFQTHKHQRSLSAPYSATRREFNKKNLSREDEKWSGLTEQISQVKLESELSLNITKEAVDCGQKAGTLMGALIGLIVTPEAFETYTHFRGSLEALENEFNQFKLGAMRGYELGETWAQLNYTARIRQNLKEIKQKQLDFDNNNKNNTEIKNKSKSKGKNKNKKISKPKLKVTIDDEKKESDTTSNSLFEENSELNNNNIDINTNNIFQYMVPNYGINLIANHSRKHMLKIRTLVMDDNLVRDMREQAGDLIPSKSNDDNDYSSNTNTYNNNDNDDDDFENGSKYVGELKGEFGSIESTKKRLIKFNIIDLGPLLELSDKLALNNEQKIKNDGKNKTKNEKELEETPLTSALSKVGKLFMKFSVARKKTENSAKIDKNDEENLLTNYLNGNHDSGDGYLCGTFSQISSHLANISNTNNDDNDNNNELIQDDFGLEIAILDELYNRIEKSPSTVETVNLVENVITKVTTMAPKQIESFNDKTTSTTETPKLETTRLVSIKTTTNLPTTSSSTTTTTSIPTKYSFESRSSKFEFDDKSDNKRITTKKPYHNRRKAFMREHKKDKIFYDRNKTFNDNDA